MADVRLAHATEMKLRQAYGYLHSWSSNGLVNRLLEEDIGVASRNTAYKMIGQGVDAGLLLRTGTLGNFTYVIDRAWKPNAVEARMRPLSPRPLSPGRDRVEAPRIDAEPARDYVGPAMGSAPLTPALGLRAHEGVDADGELLPCIGGAIAARLRSSFDALFVAAE